MREQKPLPMPGEDAIWQVMSLKERVLHAMCWGISRQNPEIYVSTEKVPDYSYIRLLYDNHMLFSGGFGTKFGKPGDLLFAQDEYGPDLLMHKVLLLSLPGFAKDNGITSIELAIGDVKPSGPRGKALYGAISRIIDLENVSDTFYPVRKTIYQGNFK